MIDSLRTVVVGPSDAPLVVVMLHGFMMTPEDISPFARSIGVPALWLFPEGPIAARPVGRAWWDMDPAARAAALARGARDFAHQSPPDLPLARTALAKYVDAAAALAQNRPLVVGGFSQGAMLLVDLLVHEPRPLAGIFLLSSSRVAVAAWPSATEPLSGMPALVSHGRTDADLAFASGEALRRALTDRGAAVTWLPFEGGHEIPLQVWRSVRKFLVARIPPSRRGSAASSGSSEGVTPDL